MTETTTQPANSSAGAKPSLDRPKDVGYYFEATEQLGELPLIAVRMPVYLVIAVFAVALAYSIVAKADVVVAGSAVLIPQGRVWNLQTDAGGKVQRVLVQEGDAVRKGQLLVQFDKQASSRSLAAISTELHAASAAITATAHGAIADLHLDVDLSTIPSRLFSPAIQDLWVQYSKARFALVDTDRTLTKVIPLEEAGLASETDVQGKRIRAMDQMVEKGRSLLGERSQELAAQVAAKRLEADQLRRDLALAEQRRSEYQKLREHNAIRQEDFDQAKAEANRLKTNLAIAGKDLEHLERSAKIAGVESANQVENLGLDLANAQATLQSSRARLERLKSEALSNFARARSDLADVVFLLQQRLAQTEAQDDFQAPIDGVITALKVRHAGEVLPAGQVIATLAPKDSTMGAEILVANKDIGLIREGMPVKYKLLAFPYQDYGVLHGKVTRISRDISLEDKQTEYRVDANLDSPNMQTQRGPIPLRYGMLATAEIVTARKPIISFVLEHFRKKPQFGP